MSDNPYAAPVPADRCQDCEQLKRECDRLRRDLFWAKSLRTWRTWWQWFCELCVNMFFIVFSLATLVDMLALAVFGLMGAIKLVEYLF